MLLEKCDDIQITLSNCHVVFDAWPNGSRVKERALEFIKGYAYVTINMTHLSTFTLCFFYRNLNSLIDKDPVGFMKKSAENKG